MKRLVIPTLVFMNSERASELYCDEILTGDGQRVIVDIPGSVSALTGQDKRESCIREFTLLGEKLLLSRWPYGS